MRITFDPNKRELTRRHRSLDFADTARIFAGPHITISDGRKDYGEARYISAGLLDGRMVVAVWTPRGDARHIISMRYCHAKEAQRWLKAIEEKKVE
jgi:uncharacterized DUF497 family protein